MESSEQCPPDSAQQEVNPVFLQQLRELDIPEEAARQVCINQVTSTAANICGLYHKASTAFIHSFIFSQGCGGSQSYSWNTGLEAGTHPGWDTSPFPEHHTHTVFHT